MLMFLFGALYSDPSHSLQKFGYYVPARNLMLLVKGYGVERSAPSSGVRPKALGGCGAQDSEANFNYRGNHGWNIFPRQLG